MAKKTPIDPEEIALFHNSVKDVKPWAEKKVRMPPPPKAQVKIRPEEEKTSLFSFSDREYLAPVAGEEYMEFKQTAVSHKILRKLRHAQYTIEAILDLHRLTTDEARIQVDQFLQHCLADDIRVVLIIHGKGFHSSVPTLKNRLNHWLRELDIVLAFCSAKPADGHRGAMYVLLKQAKEGKSI